MWTCDKSHVFNACTYRTLCCGVLHKHIEKGTPALRRIIFAAMRATRPLPSTKGCTCRIPTIAAAALACTSVSFWFQSCGVEPDSEIGLNCAVYATPGAVCGQKYKKRPSGCK